MIEYFLNNIDFLASIRFSHLFGGVFLLLIIIRLVYSLMTWRQLKRLGIKAEGTFSGYRLKLNMGTLGRIPVIEFMTEEGKYMKVEYSFSLVTKRYCKGEKVDIIYLKEEPETIMMERGNESWIGLVVFTLLFSIAIVFMTMV